MSANKDFDTNVSQMADLHKLEGYVDWKGKPAHKYKHGGMRAAVFILVAEGFENMAFLSILVNLVTYFIYHMNIGGTESANTLTNFVGTSFLLALFGGFISDSYISRLKTNVIFGFIELIGYTLLAIQAHYPSLKPPTCDQTAKPPPKCEPVSGGNATILFCGLYLIALGTGGIKASLPTLGADQFDDKDPRERRAMSNYFNWFMFSVSVAASIAVTCIVWIQNNKGWDWGFGIAAGSVFLAIISIIIGMSTYRNQVPGGSPLARIAQVFVVSFRNRKLPLPENAGELHEVHDKEAVLQIEILQNTHQFRFLDKAAIVLESSEDQSPWRLCTVTQVEQTKILLRLLPIFASTIIMNTCLAQLQTFSVQQGITMDTSLGGGLKIAPASLPIIPLAFMTIHTPIYDRIFVPFASRITGHETGITHLQRVGVGLVLSAVSMAIAGAMEVKRKNVGREHGFPPTIPISVFWLGFQYLVFGIADLFIFVGLMEFFYSEAPSGMKSLSTCFNWLSMALGYFLSTVLVEIVNAATVNKKAGSEGWLEGSLNQNHLEYFYWTLATLSILNFFNYLYWATWYKYKPVPLNQTKNSSAD